MPFIAPQMPYQSLGRTEEVNSPLRSLTQQMEQHRLEQDPALAHPTLAAASSGIGAGIIAKRGNNGEAGFGGIITYPIGPNPAQLTHWRGRRVAGQTADFLLLVAENDINVLAKIDRDGNGSFNSLAAAQMNITNPMNASLFREGLTTRLAELRAGESMNTTGQPPGTWPGQAIEIAHGSYPFADMRFQTGRGGFANAPVVTVGPTMKITRTERLTAAQTINQYGVTDATAALMVNSQSVPESQVQTVAIAGVAVTHADGTVNGSGYSADAVGMAGVGYSTRANHTGFGGNFTGAREHASGYAQGIECQVQNNAHADDVYSASGDASSRTYALRLGGYGGSNANGTDASLCGVGLQFETHSRYATGRKTGFQANINFQPLSARLYDLDSQSEAATSYRIGGSHQYGIDLSQGAISEAALLLARAQTIKWRNAAGNASIPAIAVNDSDRLLLMDRVEIDNVGNVTVPGQLRAGSARKLLTTTAGDIDGAVVALGTLPAAAYQPGRVTAATGTDLSLVVGSGSMMGANGAASINFGGTVPHSLLAAYVSTSVARNLRVWLLPTGVIAADGADAPAWPVVPTGAALLADIATPAYGAGTQYLTQANITGRRSLLGFRDAATAAAGSSDYNAGDVRGTQLHEIFTGTKAYGGGSAGAGGGHSLLRSAPSDASVTDLIGYRYVSPNVRDVTTTNGNTIQIAATPTNTVFVANNYRTKRLVSTTSVNLAGQAAGRYVLFANFNDLAGSLAWVSSYALASAWSASATETALAYFRWNGTTVSDLDWSPSSAAVPPSLLRPRVVTWTAQAGVQGYQAAYTIPAAATQLPNGNWIPFTYDAASTGLVFKGTFNLLVRTGSVAGDYNVYAYLNGGQVGGQFAAKSLPVTIYETMTMPVAIPLALGVNTISFSINGPATGGSQVQGGYMLGEITGAA